MEFLESRPTPWSFLSHNDSWDQLTCSLCLDTFIHTCISYSIQIFGQVKFHSGSMNSSPLEKSTKLSKYMMLKLMLMLAFLWLDSLHPLLLDRCALSVVYGVSFGRFCCCSITVEQPPACQSGMYKESELWSRPCLWANNYTMPRVELQLNRA